jgi:hypothetical protein
VDRPGSRRCASRHTRSASERGCDEGSTTALARVSPTARHPFIAIAPPADSPIEIDRAFSRAVDLDPATIHLSHRPPGRREPRREWFGSHQQMQPDRHTIERL